MVKVPKPEQVANKWVKGNLSTPPMPCKHCGKNTRAWWHKGVCEYCGGILPYSEAMSLANRLGLRR
jgi:hypothetical protein